MQLYGILRIALRSCHWQNHFIEYPSKIWTFTKSSSAHTVILIIVLVFILKNHFIVLVLLIRSRLIMTKTFVHWTEDIIQSRHCLAQLYGILCVALCSCYLQNHLWTTAELTVYNRRSPYARNALHRYVINMSSNMLFPTYTYLWSWQCFYWLKISRCKNCNEYIELIEHITTLSFAAIIMSQMCKALLLVNSYLVAYLIPFLFHIY
jgi:hypothetical protein